MMISKARPFPNRLKQARRLRNWSQDQVAEQSGISRAAVSAIEINRLVPSVAAALALAKVFECTVEDLFGEPSGPEEESWAWLPVSEPCCYWRAKIGGRFLRFPAEITEAGVVAHDGIFNVGEGKLVRDTNPEQSLVMASCDPAAGLLAAEYARATGFRLLPLHRSSRHALHLLQRGLVHIAGIHLASTTNKTGNASAAKAVLGSGYRLVRVATWDEGLAIQPTLTKSSVEGVVRANLRWIGREPGAGARQCQDEVLEGQRTPRRFAQDHRGVADAIRCGWADVGVCLRLVSEQTGLKFLHVRHEAYDLCFAAALYGDTRLKKLIEVLRSNAIRSVFASLPGYALSRAIHVREI